MLLPSTKSASRTSSDRWSLLASVACTVILTALAMTMAVWAEQGVPFQDDWALLYSFTTDGTATSDAASLLQPFNDGVYPLAKLLLRVAWHGVGSMTPVIVLNVALMAAVSLATLAYLRRHTGTTIITDCAIPLCCLNMAMLPSFTWSCLVYAFISIATVVPLTLMLFSPERLREGTSGLVWIGVALLLAMINGAAGYTYGMGIACWCLIAAFLMPRLPIGGRMALALIALIGGSGIVFLYAWTKESHVSSLTLDAARCSRVFIEMLASGFGQAGLSSRGLLGIPVAVAFAYVTWQLTTTGAENDRFSANRFLIAATAGIVLMPCIGVALARDGGLAARYIPYGVPVVLWLYTTARTRLPARPGAVITTAIASLLAATFLYEANLAWIFTKSRHAAAVALRSDAARGISPLRLSSLYADTWLLNRDEDFARRLNAARAVPMFADMAKDPKYDMTAALPVTPAAEKTAGWQYVALRIKDPDCVAVAVQYKPQRSGPYRIRWMMQHPFGEGVPADREEVAVQSRDRIHRDYLWLPKGADVVWFGVDPRANVETVEAFVVRVDDVDDNIND